MNNNSNGLRWQEGSMVVSSWIKHNPLLIKMTECQLASGSFVLFISVVMVTQVLLLFHAIKEHNPSLIAAGQSL